MTNYRVVRVWESVKANSTVDAIEKSTILPHDSIIATKMPSKIMVRSRILPSDRTTNRPGTKMSRKLTVGFRARIKKSTTSWPEYKECDVILTEISEGNRNFSAIPLKKGTHELKVENAKGEVAWIDEEDLEFVDDDVESNLNFINEYQEHEDSIDDDE